MGGLGFGWNCSAEIKRHNKKASEGRKIRGRGGGGQGLGKGPLERGPRARKHLFIVELATSQPLAVMASNTVRT